MINVLLSLRSVFIRSKLIVSLCHLVITSACYISGLYGRLAVVLLNRHVGCGVVVDSESLGVLQSPQSGYQYYVALYNTHC